MNIHKINISGVSNIYKKEQGVGQKVSSGKPAAKDDIVLSESGRVFNLALKAVKDQPEIQSEKVDAISAQVKAGKYKVSRDELADAIVKNAFFMK